MNYRQKVGDMNLISNTAKIELHLGQSHLLSLENARPQMAIECREGVLWVTASGDNQDHMLYSGQRFALPMKDSKVIIEALEDASINIIEH